MGNNFNNNNNMNIYNNNFGLNINNYQNVQYNSALNFMNNQNISNQNSKDNEIMELKNKLIKANKIIEQQKSTINELQNIINILK